MYYKAYTAYILLMYRLRDARYSVQEGLYIAQKERSRVEVTTRLSSIITFIEDDHRNPNGPNTSASISRSIKAAGSTVKRIRH
jgi:hypothetical protein